VIDTIAALATPPGLGALAIVRVSGADAHRLLRRLAPDSEELPPARVSTLVQLRDPESGEVLDRAVAVRYDRPASYTGEDVVELSCHGGWLGPALVLDACLRAGARHAEPGEFTRRAYLNGKLDLVEAEGVADVIEARSGALRRAALQQMEHGLSARVAELRDALIHLEALLSHHLDFPEEDDAPVPLMRVVAEADRVLERITTLLATAPEGELLREGALTVLAGRPNVGKSSLYNALIGQERAIVTDLPGTTRDALEATVQMGGYPFRLVDTAGLRDTGEEVERLGVEVARRYLEHADIVLLCVEAGRSLDDGERTFAEELSGTPVVLVEMKADLLAGSGVSREGSFAGRARVSVRSGDGLGSLKDLLPSLAFGGLIEGAGSVPVLTRRRQSRGLEVARRELSAFRDALEGGVPAEVAAAHLRPAETALEELLGVVSVEDVLDTVFREFCVGK